MKAKFRRPNEEPYAGKLLVRFREGLGRQLPSLLDSIYDEVNVSAGATTANIDAALTTGGIISGTVTKAAGGAAIEGINVWAYDPDGYWGGSASTDVNGDYQISGLPTGDYKVRFSGNGLNYAFEWYNDKAASSTADTVSVTSGATTSGINAALVVGGNISGRVTRAAGGAAIEGITIWASDSNGNYQGWATTDSNGDYIVNGLAAGTYTVVFDPNGQYYAREWYNDKTYSSAENVSVTAGATTSNINAALAAGGSISGRVTRASGGAAIANILVEIYDSDGNWQWNAITDANGDYTVHGLPTGSYKVNFYRNGLNYISEYYNDKATLATADAVSVTAGATTANIDASLASGGTISGTVTKAAGGAAIEGVLVTAYDLDGNWMGSATTDAGGDYTVNGLATGSYKVLFEPNGLYYVREWYNDKAYSGTPDVVSVTAGATTAGINATLAAGGSISGTVTAAVGGTAIAGINVEIYDSNGNNIFNVNTDVNGDYIVYGLVTGSYKVKFYNNGLNYISEYYNDKASLGIANAVSVTAGATTTGVNATLVAGGIISGTVTAVTGGAAIESSYVYAYDSSGNYYGNAVTDSSGDYVISGLATGSYTVQFSGNGLNYISEYYNDKASSGIANVVSVTAGATTSGIDAALAAGGIISGKVTKEVGGGIIEGIAVQVYDSDGNGMGYAISDDTGDYIVNGLPMGEYKVEFNCNGLNYFSEWYNNKADIDTADAVNVTTGATTANINAALATGGSISGTVTKVSDSSAIEGISVQVYDSGNNSWNATTDNTGAYTVNGLASGSYKVLFLGNGQNYAFEWYNDKVDSGIANAVSVTAGATTVGINAALVAGGIITGRVTTAVGGAAIAGVYIGVYDFNEYYLGSATTDVNGDYSVNGLATSSYKVVFDPYGQNYAFKWYNTDQCDFSSANSVSVIAGATTGSIDAQLVAGGSITGRVTDALSAPIENVYILAYIGENFAIRDAVTDANGDYTMNGLATGSYKVTFDPTLYGLHYLAEWYNNKADFASAEGVSVIAAITTTNINSQLASSLTTTTTTIPATTTASPSSSSSGGGGAAAATTTTSVSQSTTTITPSTSTVPGTNTTTSLQPQIAAAFTADQTTGNAPHKVTFTDGSAGTVTKWEWDFGDGGKSTLQNPEHTYTEAGSYSVGLKVSGAEGTDSVMKVNYIIVTQNAPAADFTLSAEAGNAPLQVTFSDASTGDVTQWLWNFGDGATGTLKSEQHTYSVVGTYTVSLTITGPGGSSTKIKTSCITVNPAPLSRSASGAVTGDARDGVQISLSGPLSMSATTNAEGAFSFEGLTAGTYIITPYRQGAQFEPASREIQVALANLTGIGFSSTLQAPSFGDVGAYPPQVSADGTTPVVFTAKINVPNGSSPIASVTVDLETSGGSSKVVMPRQQREGRSAFNVRSAATIMVDDGTGSDAKAGDGIYTCTATIPKGTSPGLKAMQVTVTTQDGVKNHSFATLQVMNEITEEIEPESTETFKITNDLDNQTLIVSYSLTGASISGRVKYAAAADCFPLLQIFRPNNTPYLKEELPITEKSSEFMIPNAEAGVWTYQVTNKCPTAQTFSLQTTTAGTGIVSGTVIDAETGAQIDGASVMSSVGAGSTVTQGYYLLLHPAGMFSLTVNATGYISVAKSFNLSAGGSAEIDITMMKSGSTDSSCFLQNSLPPEDAGQLTTLRLFRDAVLQKTDSGRGYIKLYYAYSPEINALMQSDEALKNEVATCVRKYLPVAVKALKGEALKLSKKDASGIKACLLHIRQKAGAGLKTEIDCMLRLFEKGELLKTIKEEKK